MNNGDLSFIPTQSGSGIETQGDISVTPVFTPTTSAGVGDSPTTISLSQQQQVEDSTNASIPAMPPPAVLISLFQNQAMSAEIIALTVASSWTNAQHEIIRAMLDNWSNSLKEAAEQQRKKDADPDNIRKNEERLVVPNVIDAVASVVSNPTAVPGIESPASASISANANASINEVAPMMTVGLMFSVGGGTSDSMMIDNLSTDLVGVNPTRNHVAFQPNVNVFDLPAINLMVAAAMVGAANAANAKTVTSANSAEQLDPEITAKNYAEQIVKIVSSGVLTSLITALTTQKTEKGPAPNPALAAQLETQVKVVLLASALASLYKSVDEKGTGWIQGEDMEGLITGENETFGPNKALMDGILKELRSLLGSLPDGGGKMRDMLYDFFNTNPALSTLTNPTKLFSKIVPSINREPNQA